MRRVVEGSWATGIGRQPTALSRRALAEPRTLEDRVLPGTVVAAFVALLAIQIVLAM